MYILSECFKLDGDINWIKNVFPEAVKFIKRELISEFLEDLKSECLGGEYSGCFYIMDSWKCDFECPNYKLYKKWEEKLK